MLERARATDPQGRVEWVEAAAEDWDPAAYDVPADVLVTNATLQWVPSHLRLIPHWLKALAPGGTFAMQVPSNFSAPSHRLMRDVA
ncbi:methyltransferase domain-containing protein, partial [Nocardiopsis changdeensis]|uniref:methyltransferase domain-containing protein n=1 Tax=Nocardiopsis changdeensis TaxID=2831969 RepID=UPI003F47E7C5